MTSIYSLFISEPVGVGLWLWRGMVLASAPIIIIAGNTINFGTIDNGAIVMVWINYCNQCSRWQSHLRILDSSNRN